MANFPKVDPVDIKQNTRIQQQNIKSKAIKPFTVSQINLVNTQADLQGPFTVNNGSSLSILSIIKNTVNEAFRVGVLPYNIIFFEGTPSINVSTGVNNVIGYGVTGDYTINGPMGMPQFIPYAIPTRIGGNTGQNVVVLTELINNSGGAEDIYFISDSRVLNPYGGGGN